MWITWWVNLFDLMRFEVLYFGFSIHTADNVHLIWRWIRIMTLTFFDEIIIRRKFSNFFLVCILFSLFIFKTLNLLWQSTFHISSLVLLLLSIKLLWLHLFLDLKLLLLLLALVDDFMDTWFNIFKFAPTDSINPRMVNALISIWSVSVSLARVVCVIVADRGLIVVDCNILVGMIYLPFVTNAVWCWSIDGIL